MAVRGRLVSRLAAADILLAYDVRPSALGHASGDDKRFSKPIENEQSASTVR